LCMIPFEHLAEYATACNIRWFRYNIN
jgi:hypothetical protein